MDASAAGPTTPSAAGAVRLSPVPADVLFEVFDDEAVVVQLRTGVYYALDPPTTERWQRLCAGEPLDQVTAAAVGAGGSAGDVVALAHLLCQEGLMVADGPLPEHPGPTAPELAGVSRFTDMADLLVLDPIHDLDLDGDGWPAVADDAPAGGAAVAP